MTESESPDIVDNPVEVASSKGKEPADEPEKTLKKVRRRASPTRDSLATKLAEQFGDDEDDGPVIDVMRESKVDKEARKEREKAKRDEEKARIYEEIQEVCAQLGYRGVPDCPPSQSMKRSIKFLNDSLEKYKAELAEKKAIGEVESKARVKKAVKKAVKKQQEEEEQESDEEDYGPSSDDVAARIERAEALRGRRAEVLAKRATQAEIALAPFLQTAVYAGSKGRYNMDGLDEKLRENGNEIMDAWMEIAELYDEDLPDVIKSPWFSLAAVHLAIAGEVIEQNAKKNAAQTTGS